MTLKEALESGRPFKRPAWIDYDTVDKFQERMQQFISDYGALAFVEWITASDYILKPKPAVLWVNEYNNGPSFAFKTKLEAETVAGLGLGHMNGPKRIAVEYVERVEESK